MLCNLEKEKEGEINSYHLVDVAAIGEHHLDLHSKEFSLRSMADWQPPANELWIQQSVHI